MSRRVLVAGNWKMHKTAGEAAALAGEIRSGWSAGAVEALLCPPFPALAAVAAAIAGSELVLGAQNVHWEDAGAYTGEVAAPMLREVGCRYCIAGHSERRRLFGEDDAQVARKLAALWRHGISPVLCVGEDLEQRRGGRTRQVVGEQLTAALAGVVPREDLVVAYEPVWAIGTGEPAGETDAQAVAAHLRERLQSLWGAAAGEVRILYGGSVVPDNLRRFLSQPDVDGVLVGGASLRADSFLALLREASL